MQPDYRKLALKEGNLYSVTMNRNQFHPGWALPYDSPLPEEPKKQKQVRVLRTAVYLVVIATMIVPVIQFQTKTVQNERKGEKFLRENPGWTLKAAKAAGLDTPKYTKGALGRWTKAVPAFWAGDNIYRSKEDLQAAADSEEEEGGTVLHPNMPFVLILLTPFACLSPIWAALAWNIAKLASLLASLLMIAELAGHQGRKIVDWILALGFAWAITLLMSDIQHGNTNIFVLLAVVLHLWMFRRKSDLGAGAALALAICLKMTPAIFVLYWLYQRQWKLLVWTLVSLVVFAIVIPAAAVGPSHYLTLMDNWLNNLIFPGLIKGAWYPIHINQSLPGVFSRYFLEGPNGNIFWNPDDELYSEVTQFGWITLVALSPATLKILIRLMQCVIVGLMGWAIGWKILPRDDGRRLLHWGLVCVAWLLLNQRTWDHHATVLLIIDVALWQAIAFGRFSRKIRFTTLILMIAAGVLLLISKGGTGEMIGRMLGHDKQSANIFSDRLAAYGLFFYHLVLLFITGVILSVALKKQDTPYAEKRQTLGRNILSAE